MTANQINFAKQREEARHNLVTERQKLRDQAIGEISALAAQSQADTAKLRQAEDARHNQQSEAVNWFQARGTLEETSRHNKMAESIQALQQHAQQRSLERQAAVSERNASTSEKLAELQRGQLGVSQRLATVQEQQLGINRLGVTAQQSSASAALQQAAVAGINAATRQSELAEAIRLNSLVTSETSRHNQAAELNATAQATSSARQASAAMMQAQAAASNAKSNAKNATSQRIVAVSKAVDSGVRAVKGISGIARSIIGGLQ